MGYLFLPCWTVNFRRTDQAESLRGVHAHEVRISQPTTKIGSVVNAWKPILNGLLIGIAITWEV